MRHSFASRGIQYVLGALPDPAGCAGPGEQLSARDEWSGTCGAAFGDSSSGQLAARIRITAASGSEYLAVGISRLGRDATRWLAGDEAHHARHPIDLW